MKLIILALIAIMLVLLGGCQSDRHEPITVDHSDVGRTLIISHSGDPAPILEVAHRMNAEVIYNLKHIPSVIVRIPDDADVEAAIKQYSAIKGVNGVMQDQINTLDIP